MALICVSSSRTVAERYDRRYRSRAQYARDAGVAGIAQGLPGSLLVFDAVPEVMLDLVQRASGRERDLAVELWTWLFNPAERAAISAMSSVEELRDLAPPLTRSPASLGIAAISRLPRRLRYSLPVLPVLQARLRIVFAA